MGIGVAGTLVVASLAAPASGPADPAGCVDVVGVEQIVAASHVILVGEIHGTAESPAFVAAIACHANAADLAVTVGLEIPTAEQTALDAFVSSSGGETDVAALLDGGFWTSLPHDGRTSVAMLELLDSIRVAHGDGQPVSVIAIDSGDPERRDADMGQSLVDAAATSADGLIVSLTGNVHAATVALPGSTDPAPMGQHVVEALGDDRVIALDVDFVGGTAWVVLGDGAGGETYFGERIDDPGPSPAVVRTSPNLRTGFDGVYDVGYIHASPPAT